MIGDNILFTYDNRFELPICRHDIATARAELMDLSRFSGAGEDLVLYLGGPINGCTDEECRVWREYIPQLWGELYIDPMRRDYRGKEDECTADIVELDVLDCLEADALLINKPKPSDGTSMEHFLSFWCGKLIVVVVPESARISPWVRYHSHHICHSFEDAVAWIRGVCG